VAGPVAKFQSVKRVNPLMYKGDKDIVEVSVINTGDTGSLRIEIVYNPGNYLISRSICSVVVSGGSCGDSQQYTMPGNSIDIEYRAQAYRDGAWRTDDTATQHVDLIEQTVQCSQNFEIRTSDGAVVFARLDYGDGGAINGNTPLSASRNYEQGKSYTVRASATGYEPREVTFTACTGTKGITMQKSAPSQCSQSFSVSTSDNAVLSVTLDYGDGQTTRRTTPFTVSHTYEVGRRITARATAPGYNEVTRTFTACALPIQLTVQKSAAGQCTQRFEVLEVIGTSGVRLSGVKVKAGIYEAITDVNGSCSISGLAEGQSYTAIASKSGYECANCTRTFTGCTTTIITLTLRQSAPAQCSQSFTVIDENESALMGVTITVGDKTGVTFDDGKCTITGLTVGQSYTATASKDGYDCANCTRTFTGCTTGIITLTLRQSVQYCTQQFKVQDSELNLIAGAVVDLGGGKSCATGTNGICSVSGLTVGQSYTATASKSGYKCYGTVCKRTFTACDSGIYTLTLERDVSQCTQRFTVKDNVGNPLSGVKVKAGVQEVTTDVNGNCSISDLYVGQSYIATASKDGYKCYGSECSKPFTGCTGTTVNLTLEPEAQGGPGTIVTADVPTELAIGAELKIPVTIINNGPSAAEFRIFFIDQFTGAVVEYEPTYSWKDLGPMQTYTETLDTDWNAGWAMPDKPWPIKICVGRQDEPTYDNCIERTIQPIKTDNYWDLVKTRVLEALGIALSEVKVTSSFTTMYGVDMSMVYPVLREAMEATLPEEYLKMLDILDIFSGDLVTEIDSYNIIINHESVYEPGVAVAPKWWHYLFLTLNYGCMLLGTGGLDPSDITKITKAKHFGKIFETVQAFEKFESIKTFLNTRKTNIIGRIFLGGEAQVDALINAIKAGDVTTATRLYDDIGDTGKLSKEALRQLDVLIDTVASKTGKTDEFVNAIDLINQRYNVIVKTIDNSKNTDEIFTFMRGWAELMADGHKYTPAEFGKFYRTITDAPFDAGTHFAKMSGTDMAKLLENLRSGAVHVSGEPMTKTATMIELASSHPKATGIFAKIDEVGKTAKKLPVDDIVDIVPDGNKIVDDIAKKATASADDVAAIKKVEKTDDAAKLPKGQRFWNWVKATADDAGIAWKDMTFVEKARFYAKFVFLPGCFGLFIAEEVIQWLGFGAIPMWGLTKGWESKPLDRKQSVIEDLEWFLGCREAMHKSMAWQLAALTVACPFMAPIYMKFYEADAVAIEANYRTLEQYKKDINPITGNGECRIAVRANRAGVQLLLDGNPVHKQAGLWTTYIEKVPVYSEDHQVAVIGKKTGYIDASQIVNITPYDIGAIKEVYLDLVPESNIPSVSATPDNPFDTLPGPSAEEVADVPEPYGTMNAGAHFSGVTPPSEEYGNLFCETSPEGASIEIRGGQYSTWFNTNLTTNDTVTSILVGAYDVRFELPDGRTCTASNVTVQAGTPGRAFCNMAKPVAAFDYSPTSPSPNEAVRFDASDSTPGGGTSIASYKWYSNDVYFGVGKTFSKIFPDGSYAIKLEVTNSQGGKDSTTRTMTVSTSTCPGPNASFTASTVYPNVNDPVMFDASASAPGTGQAITNYAWKFGDGRTGTGRVVNHAFTTASDFVVTLTVTNDCPQPRTDVFATSVHVDTPSGTIRCRCDRSDARIILDDVDTGRLTDANYPVNISTTPGSHKIQYDLVGAMVCVGNITVMAGVDVDFQCTLVSTLDQMQVGITTTVTDITDGDTIRTARTDQLPERVPGEPQSIRMAGFDAAESGTASGIEATNLLREMIPVGSVITLKVDKYNTLGYYNRVLGGIFRNGVDVNLEMLKSCLVDKSSGQDKFYWVDWELYTANWCNPELYGNITVSVYDINSQPLTGSTVYVDNIDKGNAPVTIKNLTYGPHVVRVEKSGYVSCGTGGNAYQPCSFNATVTAGQTTVLNVILSKDPITPPSADVVCSWIDESDGTNNLTIDHALYIYYLSEGYTSLAETKYQDLPPPKPSRLDPALATLDNSLGVYYYSEGYVSLGNTKTGCVY